MNKDNKQGSSKGVDKVKNKVFGIAESAGINIIKVADSTSKNVVKAADVASKNVAKVADVASKNVIKSVDATGKTSIAVAKKTADIAMKSKEAVFQAIDQNGNGQVDIEDVIYMGFKIPGIKVDRETFLRKELFKYYPQDVIDAAVQFNPLYAKVNKDDIDKIANNIINNERLIVSGLAAALGAPGGMAMVATIPADIAQYYGCMLRVIQKLLYLYGFPELDLNEDGEKIDSGTMNMLILCMGVMYGVANVNNGIKLMAKALAKGVEKKLLDKALTKGIIYPIVKNVSKWFGVKMTKDVFAGFFKKSIPVAGGVIGGGITFITFKPCCDRLKMTLQDTMLSNPDYKSDDYDLDLIADGMDIVDVEVEYEL